MTTDLGARADKLRSRLEVTTDWAACQELIVTALRDQDAESRAEERVREASELDRLESITRDVRIILADFDRNPDGGLRQVATNAVLASIRAATQESALRAKIAELEAKLVTQDAESRSALMRELAREISDVLDGAAADEGGAEMRHSDGGQAQRGESLTESVGRAKRIVAARFSAEEAGRKGEST